MQFLVWFGWYFVALLYRLYAFFVQVAWACRGETSSSFLVDSTGSQLKVTEWNDEMCAHPALLLTIFYTRAGIRYRFTELTAGESAFDTLKTVRGWAAPSSIIVGLKVDIKDHEFVLDPKEFWVVGNTLFSKTFNRWLCRHYLNIPVTDQGLEVMAIDETMSIVTIDAPVLITPDGMRAIKAAEPEDDSVGLELDETPNLVDRALDVMHASAAAEAMAEEEPSAEASSEEARAEETFTEARAEESPAEALMVN